MKKLLTSLAIIVLTGICSYAHADIIWNQNFSNVSNWMIIDPSGGSTITSDGTLGLLYVNGANTQAAFIPNTVTKPFVPFNPAQKNQYTLYFNINSITWSTSYDIALDEFDSNKSWLDTMSSSSSTLTGSYSINLGGFTFNANTAYLMPKIIVYTGDGGQTVKISGMSFNYAPSCAGNFTTFDNFDSHTWTDSGNSSFARAVLSYSPKRNTQGSNELMVTAPLQAIPAGRDWSPNNFEFTLTRNLPQPEDWSNYDFITTDIYVEDKPTSLPTVFLTLYNSQGASVSVPLVLSWQLFQWDNRQMTWPLKGNQYFVPPIPTNILNNVVKVSISARGLNDGQYGPAISFVDFHFDNMKLGGKDLWDAFDGPGYGWYADGDSSAIGGITHNNTYNNSAGALCLSWNYASTANYAEVRTTDFASQDWSGYTNIKANVKCSDITVPIAIYLWDGTAGRQTAGQTVQIANQWQTICWQLPADDASFSKSHIAVVKVVANNIDAHRTGNIYVDNLAVGKLISNPTGLSATADNLQNYISWDNPPDPNFVRTMIRCRTDTYPASSTDGTLVCEKTNGPDTTDSFIHTGLTAGQTYYYSAFAYNGTGYSAVDATAQSQASQDIIRVSGSGYEAGFSKTNGAILYITDKATGKSVGRGSDQGTLWKIIFFDENITPSLSAAEFSPGSTTKHFSYTTDPLVLTYSYNLNGQSLTLNVTVTPSTTDYFDLTAQITNNMGLPVRTVSLPSRVTFDKTKVNNVVLPIQEGMMLLPNFFLSNKSTSLTRPPLSADCLALNSQDGQLGIYMIQDSLYQANIIPNHDPSVPVFQPNNLGVGTAGNLGYFNFDMVTYIPNGANWSSVTSRFKLGNNFRQIAAAYRHDNGFDNTANYPTLKQKLDKFGMFENLSRSPILVVEASKVIDLAKAPLGQEWSTIANSWLSNLPTPSVMHITHWQYGRDWNGDPTQNHLLEDNHPDCQPVWWDKYGSQSDLLSLLNKLKQGGFVSMPFTDWEVWNKVDPVTHQLPTLSQTPAAARTLRGEDYPFITYSGYMTKPWHNDTITADLQMINTTYTTTYPMDMLFVDMTGETFWRYVLMDDNVTASACAYTQATVDEDLRLSAYKPLFTEGVFDRIANSITGYCQTTKQKYWNGVLLHLGTEYQDWTAYPFAADVVHSNVGFYQHNLNVEVFPAASTALFTYYTTFGYNYMVDMATNYGQSGYWIDTCDAFQKAVCSRTFGQSLVDYQILTPDYKHISTIWGNGTNNITITANCDASNTYAVGNNTIAAAGFLATTASGDVEAGVFDGTFNGAALTAGQHWLTVENVNNVITIRQPQGPDTSLTINRPSGWTVDNQIYLVKAFKNGTETLGSLTNITPTTLVFNFNATDPATGYTVSKYKLYGAQSSSIKPPFFTSLPTAGSLNSISEVIGWTTDTASNSVIEYGLDATYGYSANDTNLVTSHQIILAGLTTNTLYHYRVKSTGSNGQTAVSGDFTFVAGGVSWQENFNPMKTTWLDNNTNPGDNCTITGNGNGTGTEKVIASTYGKVESEVITLDANSYPNLLVRSTAVDAGASYTVQIEEVGGNTANAISNITQPGTNIVNVASLMGWKGVHSFRVAIWVGGGLNKSATLNLIAANANLAQISGKVTLQSRTNQSAPIVFELRNPGQTTPIKTYTITTDSQGNFNLINVAPGTYDLTAKGSNFLRAKQTNIAVSTGQVTPNINFSLLGGDADNNNVVSMMDLAILQAAYGTKPGDAKWNARADFNGNNQIDMTDLSILRANYGKSGAQ